MEEPSVLDYLKDKLSLRRLIHRAEMVEEPPARSTNPHADAEPTQAFEEQSVRPTNPNPWLTQWPWFTSGALVISLLAQRALEPPHRSITEGTLGYLLAGAMLLAAIWRKEFVISLHPQSGVEPDPMTARKGGLLTGVIASLVTFLAFGGGTFSSLNLILWSLALLGFLWAFWIPNSQVGSRKQTWIAVLKAPRWEVIIPHAAPIVVLITIVVLYFRLSRLTLVPPEMVSDQAEKLLDVWDVLNGNTPVFFPRNTGREALQMYLTAGITLLFGTGVSFLSLKIGMALAGLLMLPFLYLAGREVGNQRIGLFAVMFAGVAYWPNVISRVALRFALYPLFVAPALYYLLRGFRTANRNDFLLSGIFIGLGLHGYSPFRVVPVLVLVAFGLYLLHPQSKGFRGQGVFHLLLVCVMSLVVFIPLLRYMVDDPQMFLYRSISRLGSVEKPLDAPAGQILVKNTLRALAMFGWDDGEVWVVSIPHRPALSVVSAALFHLGVILVLVRYIKKRHWVDIFLLLSIPILMLPSILSLAFPAENPILNRTSGAIIPVFLIIGISLDSLTVAFRSGSESLWRNWLVWVISGLIFIGAAVQDYDLVFRQYREQYARSAWNNSEMGMVLRDFSQSIGSPQNVWVVAYPYWVDTRLVAIEAGYIDLNPVISPEKLAETQSIPGAKLFMIYPQDTASIDELKMLYPTGVMKEYTSRVPDKNFWMYFVPPQNAAE